MHLVEGSIEHDSIVQRSNSIHQGHQTKFQATNVDYKQNPVRESLP